MAINNIQFTSAKYSAGIADTQLLADGLFTRPDIARYVYMATKKDNYMRYILSFITDKYTYTNNNEYKWFVQTELTKPQNISSQVRPLTNTGINNQPFVVPFTTNYFKEGDVLNFPSTMQARVMGSPTQVGVEYYYTLQLVDRNPASFLPASDIVVGTPISYLYNAFEEYSVAGDTKRAFPLGFSNRLIISRHSNVMTGSAATDGMYLNLSFTRKNKVTGKDQEITQQYFTSYSEEVCRKLVAQEQEGRDWWSKYNVRTDGTVGIAGPNGRQINVGAGIIDQIAASNTFLYDPQNLTEKQLRNFLMDLQLANPESSESHFFCFCGIGFFDAFNSAMQNFLQGRIIDNSFYVANDTTERKNIRDTLKFGAEFTTYRGILGSKFTLIHVPMFDDKNKWPTPYLPTGLPKQSYTAVFLPMISSDGDVMVELMAKQDRLMNMWYECGSMIPKFMDGKIKESSLIRSSSVDGFRCNWLSESGIKITNPTAAGMMRVF